MSFYLKKKDNLSRFGVGFKKLKNHYDMLGLNYKPNRVKLKLKHKEKIDNLIKKNTFGGTLELKVKRAITHYITLKSYKGTRHKHHRPVRGQRTHTNAKTARKLFKKSQSLSRNAKQSSDKKRTGKRSNPTEKRKSTRSSNSTTKDKSTT
jgi:small subunit ribosomal protein S13